MSFEAVVVSGKDACWRFWSVLVSFEAVVVSGKNACLRFFAASGVIRGRRSIGQKRVFAFFGGFWCHSRPS